MAAVAAVAALDSAGMDVASSTSSGSALQHVSGCISKSKLGFFGCLHPTGSSHCRYKTISLNQHDTQMSHASQDGSGMDAILTSKNADLTAYCLLPSTSSHTTARKLRNSSTHMIRRLWRRRSTTTAPMQQQQHSHVARVASATSSHSHHFLDS